MMKIEGLDHIDIAVEDVDAVSAFFVAIGCTVVRQEDHEGKSVELRLPGQNQPIIELTQTKRTDGRVYPPGLRHIGLKCDDIQALFSELSKQGVRFSGPPKNVKGRMLLNALDPEGKPLIQFVQ